MPETREEFLELQPNIDATVLPSSRPRARLHDGAPVERSALPALVYEGAWTAADLPHFEERPPVISGRLSRALERIGVPNLQRFPAVLEEPEHRRDVDRLRGHQRARPAAVS